MCIIYFQELLSRYPPPFKSEEPEKEVCRNPLSVAPLSSDVSAREKTKTRELAFLLLSIVEAGVQVDYLPA